MEQATAITGQMLFTEADYLLDSAKHELERSQEDVVVPMVCFNARLSISNYLRGFLMTQGSMPVEPFTLEHLLAQCHHHEKAFRQLDFAPIECSHEDDNESYCLATEKVEECVELADHTRSIIRNVLEAQSVK